VGHILLEGGAEFGGDMAQADLRALELAGGFDACISIISAAAAPDNNHERAGKNAVRWFRRLGASQVTALPLIDRLSASNREIADALRRSRLIFMLGGFPYYLARTLADSISWEAILAAYGNGAIIGGSSAGAMVLCERFYDPFTKRVEKGLKLLPETAILPHHNTFGRQWSMTLLPTYPEMLLVGIDEETGMINDGPNGQWQVYGKGSVTLHSPGKSRSIRSGVPFSFSG
jgi:cyanophycinase